MVGELLLLLATHLVLTALPGVAAAMFLASRGERRVPVLLAVALAASGVGGMLGFWIYYGSHLLGQSFTYVLAIGSALATGWLLYGGGIERSLLRRLSIPLGLWVLGSAFLVFFGFMHGGADTALGTASNRFGGTTLPSDIDIPLYFAEFFYTHSHHGVPPEFPGEWLASDRPPLQVGYVLSQQPFAFNSPELSYEILGVCLQQLWIVGLWALLVAAGVGRLTKALAMVAVLASPLVFVNGFFVWPKLLPAAMLLAAAALLVTPLWAEMRSRLWAGALVGALLGLAMMGHGSSAFPILALVLIPAFRGLPSRRWVAVGLGVLIVVMAPWSVYQKWGDPPGNRLIKWQIGGVINVDSRGSLETIEDSYEEAGIGGTIHNKAENLVTVTGGGMFASDVKQIWEATGRGEITTAVRELRGAFFLYLLPSLGLLLLGPLAMLAAIRRKRPGDPADWHFARDCLLVFAVGGAGWCLLMFGNGAARTVIHQGSYFLPIIGVCACIAGLRAVLPRLGTWIVGISTVLMLALYAPALGPGEGNSYSFGTILLAAIFLLGFCWLLWRSDIEDP
ncbi:MAG TPA: hypothetical protein VIJ21_10405, partial [Solirubrobacterales bacterium]